VDFGSGLGAVLLKRSKRSPG